MAAKSRDLEVRVVAGVELELPRLFFEWTNLPFAQGYALAAFAFHIEYESAKWERRKLPGTIRLPDMRHHIGLSEDKLRISSFYGGIEILNAIPPLRQIGLNEEGRVSAISDDEQRSTTDIFDSLRPRAREEIVRFSNRVITLEALEVRGRPESPLAAKIPIEWGCFLAGFESDRGRAMMMLDGAKLYDVEVRVAPRLRPDDLPRSPRAGEPSSNLPPRRLAILEVVGELWPSGVPASLTKKERDQAIIQRLRAQGLAIPHPKTIKRALEGERDKS